MKLLAIPLAVALVACAATPSSLPAPRSCPEPPATECPEPRTKVVRVKQKCPTCPVSPPAAAKAAVADKIAPVTCVFGHVKTVGEMRLVVQRAHVVVRSTATVLAESWTDDNGAFAACIDSRRITEPTDVTVDITKQPFTPVTLRAKLNQGQHRELQVGFAAQGLTD